MFCRNCGREMNPNAEYCSACGVKYPNGNRFCQSCGAETRPNQEMCVQCGVRLGTSRADSAWQPSTGTTSNVRFCRNCGKPVDHLAEYCPNCGVRPLRENSYCQACGVETRPDQEMCVQCGARLRALRFDEDGTQLNTDFSDLHPHYQREFQKILESGESYKGSWNWTAFLCGGLWGFAKGTWLAALISIIGALLTNGVLGVVYWFVFGFRGTYIYYCAHVKRKQIPF